MYKVIKEFTDLQDDNHLYKVGDTYPYDGKKINSARLEQLASSANRQGTPLIAEEKSEISNPAIPAQPEKVERGTPFMNPPEVSEDEKEEPVKEIRKPAKRGRKNKD